MTAAPAPLEQSLAGRYRFDREIGRGGMATVYLAEDLKHGRQVAIKVLKPELTQSLGVERFLREIGIAARLSHPHLVPLLDSGEAGGILYYVSTYVTGGSLRDRLLREPRLPVADAIRIATEVGDGLQYAHRAGFVHRDVKPENILFVDDHAVLTDFGVARACTSRAGDLLTGAGFAVGTPEYMSPEQAAGEQDLQVSSDIYSLACVLFEMLTGEPPFRGDSAHTTIARHIAEPPRLVRVLRPDAPLAVEQAIARALSKDPAARFTEVGEFSAALRREDPARTRLPSTATHLLAVLPLVNATPDPGNEYISDGITDELIDALSKVRGLRVASRTSVFALKGKPQDVRAIGALLGASVVLEGTVRRAGDRVRIGAQLSSTDDGRLIWSDRFDRDLDDLFALQDEIAQTIVKALRTALIADLSAPLRKRYTDSGRAWALYLRGRFEWNKRSQEGVAAGIRFFEQAIAEDPGFAPAYTGLADSWALHVDYRSVPVHEGFQRATEYARQAIALDDSLAEAHASLAWCLFIHDWDWSGARAEYERAIALDPSYATAHQWYAFLLSAWGRHEEALLEVHAALELDPASVSIRRSLGWAYYYARRYEQARYHLDRAIAMNPTAEESYRVLGLSLLQLDRAADAERVLREACELPTSGTYTRSTLAYVLARTGRAVEARGILDALLEESSREYVSPVAMATVHLGLGEWERALDFTEEAFRERRGWLAYLRVNPIFDPLRAMPRFEALARQMGL